MPLQLGTWRTSSTGLIIESDGSGGFKGTIDGRSFSGGFFNEQTQEFSFFADFNGTGHVFTGTLFKNVQLPPSPTKLVLAGKIQEITDNEPHIYQTWSAFFP